MAIDLDALLAIATDAARAASDLIASKRLGQFNIERKANADSLAAEVVTEVDRAAEAIIRDHLLPTIGPNALGYLGEESTDNGSRFSCEAFWCVDPIDGTLPFIEGTPGFATSIALVARDGSPLLGVVADPVTSKVWAVANRRGVTLNNKPFTPSRPSAVFTVFADRSLKNHPHFEESMGALNKIADELKLGPIEINYEAGAVLNVMKILENRPACYFKFRKPDGGGSLWDYAATACFFAELGLPATDLDGRPLDLNREDSAHMNHRGIVYASSEEIAQAVRVSLGH